MRLAKFIFPALALGLFAAIPTLTVRADDAPATQPAQATGSITIKVVDSDGKPVSGAAVRLVAKEKPAGGGKPEAVAQGNTDDQGQVVLKDVPQGTYRAMAKLKGTGNGRENVTISADSATAAPVTITLKPKPAAN